MSKYSYNVDNVNNASTLAPENWTVLLEYLTAHYYFLTLRALTVTSNKNITTWPINKHTYAFILHV